jgi:hypothetical protein
MEDNNDSYTTQTSGGIGVDRIMELDPGPIENDDASNSSDPENCDTDTMCYFMTLYLHILFCLTT